jgi:hypothetical protein
VIGGRHPEGVKESHDQLWDSDAAGRVIPRAANYAGKAELRHSGAY